jgi:hypothetical protein
MTDSIKCNGPGAMNLRRSQATGQQRCETPREHVLASSAVCRPVCFLARDICQLRGQQIRLSIRHLVVFDKTVEISVLCA